MSNSELIKRAKEKNKIISDEDIDYLFTVIMDDLHEFYMDAYKKGSQMTKEVFRNE